jgi:hypothetical protein
MTITIIIITIVLFTTLGGGNLLYRKFSKKARVKKAQGYTGLFYCEKPLLNRDFDRWLSDHSNEIGVRKADLLHNMKKDKIKL